MNCRKLGSWILLLLSSYLVIADSGRDRAVVLMQTESQSKTIQPEFIRAEELKTKLARSEPLTVIDVRDTSSYVGSDSRIKGALHVKLRRLNYRLSFAPLKDVPRDSEVVTYCACPNDEASIRAAQILSDAGFKRVYVLRGGWRMWLKVAGQVEPRAKA
ncbi:MAG TPA: rhodanese-like domain-containing protein [Pyrinomonadaceae bacterium]|nr:rhodanese-like domain-containing protein [Pyrinomonadaceae bacterium]